MNDHTPKRVHRSHAQWQELVDTQLASGQSAAAFCQEYGVGYASFCRWRKRLSGNAGGGIPGSRYEKDFIELSELHGSDSGRWQIILKLGDGMELQLTRR